MKKIFHFKTIALLFFLSPLSHLHSQSLLSMYGIDKKKTLSSDLTKALAEISGIAFSEDGRLFAHGDEEGTIFQIDYMTGSIVKKFYLGPKSVRQDFEDIAIVQSRFFLLTSSVVLYEFAEGKEGEKVQFKMYRTHLKSSSDVEGLCYDPETNSLLIACKDFPGKGYLGNRTVYSFSLKKMKLEDKPRFILPLNQIESKARHHLFKPSGIARHPKTGSFFVLAANGETIVEVSKAGKILDQATFPKGVHRQAEGIAFAPDYTLLITDEGAGGKAKLTRYPMKLK